MTRSLISFEHLYEADILEDGQIVEVVVIEKYVKDKDHTDVVVMTDEGFVSMRLVSRELSRRTSPERKGSQRPHPGKGSATMLGHGKRSHTPMHATPAPGTRTATHLQPHPRQAPMDDHPAGGGDMPLPGGDHGGGSMSSPPEPHMPMSRAVLPKVGHSNKSKFGY